LCGTIRKKGQEIGWEVRVNWTPTIVKKLQHNSAQGGKEDGLSFNRRKKKGDQTDRQKKEGPTTTEEGKIVEGEKL